MCFSLMLYFTTSTLSNGFVTYLLLSLSEGPSGPACLVDSITAVLTLAKQLLDGAHVDLVVLLLSHGQCPDVGPAPNLLLWDGLPEEAPDPPLHA